jgi:putative nucleotidyltransferase with HDIG domain
MELKTNNFAGREPRLKPRPWSRIAERVESSRRAPSEVSRAAPIVLTTAALSLGAIAILMALPSLSAPATAVPFALVGVAFVAEILVFRESNKGSAGSIAQIPFAAAIILHPSYRTVIAVGVAMMVAQLWHRRPLIKGLFNVCQVLLSTSAGVLAFRLARGSSLSVASGFVESFAGLLLPTTLVSLAYTAVNTTAVVAVISRVSNERFGQSWLRANRSTLSSVPLNVVFAIYLAWLAQNLGAVGALGMVVPLLAMRQLSRTTVELTNVTEELLDLMVAAIEARDPYTSGHSKRVARASKTIAVALGLKAEQVERVEVAALLHDVGKIDEQFARILAKEGRLTPDEWATMKCHPVRSAELVGMLSSLKDIVPAVRHHHENWDGTGYPDGIAGEGIPLASRIIMFADTLDAITTDRPYRKALDAEEARREFVKFRGKQFDPSVCDVVIDGQVWSRLYMSIRENHDVDATDLSRKIGVA